MFLTKRTVCKYSQKSHSFSLALSYFLFPLPSWKARRCSAFICSSYLVNRAGLKQKSANINDILWHNLDLYIYFYCNKCAINPSPPKKAIKFNKNGHKLWIPWRKKMVFVMHYVFNGTQMHICYLHLKITKRNLLDCTENYFLRVSKFHSSKNTKRLFKGKTMFSVFICWLCQSVNITELVFWVQNAKKWSILSEDENAQLLVCDLGFFPTVGV